MPAPEAGTDTLGIVGPTGISSFLELNGWVWVDYQDIDETLFKRDESQAVFSVVMESFKATGQYKCFDVEKSRRLAGRNRSKTMKLHVDATTTSEDRQESLDVLKDMLVPEAALGKMRHLGQEHALAFAIVAGKPNQNRPWKEGS